MKPSWVGLFWAAWAIPIVTVAVARGLQDRWLFAFLGTSSLLLLDFGSLKAFAAVVLRPTPTPPEPKWRRRGRIAGLVLFRLAPWVGLALLMKTVPPKEAPVAHLLGWATLPWIALWMALLPRLLSKKL